MQPHDAKSSKTEVEREKASSFKANVLETSYVLQMLHVTAEKSVKTGWPNLPESVTTEGPKEAAASHP